MSITNIAVAGNHWWKVTLEKRIVFRRAVVFVRNGPCGGTECSSRLSDVYFLTNKDITATAPNTAGNGGWNICYHNNTAQGDSYSRGCNRGRLTPVTRLFSIRTNSGQSVALREVEIYGDVLPQLNEDINQRVDSRGYDKVTISFMKWNTTLPGTVAPSRYAVSTEPSKTVTIEHDNRSALVSVVIDGLVQGKNYTFTIKCQVEDVDCPGPHPTHKGSTQSCSTPDKPSFSLPKFYRNEDTVTHLMQLEATKPNCLNIMEYRLTLTPVSQRIHFPVNPKEGRFNITGLEPYTRYTVTVVVINDAELNNTLIENITTAEIFEPSPPAELQLKSNKTCVFLTATQPSSPNGHISHFKFTCREKMSLITSLSDKKTFAVICGFAVNDNVSCSVSAKNSVGFGDAAGASIVVGVENLVDGTSSENNIQVPIAVASVVGTFALVVACLLLVVYIRRRRSHSKNDKRVDFSSRKERDGPTDATHSLDLPAAELEEQSPEVELEENQYGNARGALVKRSESIPIEKLHWYNSTNIVAIKIQYNELERLPKPNMSEALQPKNKGKCRYRNLYPSNKHRVKLVREGGNTTDFINASYMRGYSRDNQYIAAQGPFTDEVVNDFWLMIWQQQPSVIVMVTKAVEYNKMKCLQYWPNALNTSATYGEISVTLKSAESWSDFGANHFLVVKDGEKRKIPHFTYSSWPDHGVPDLEVFITFRRLINSTIGQKGKRPLLLHCSAGVGRTGTYIALDYLVDQAKNEGSVNMFDCVKDMRSRRPCMLQTDEQYIFLHHVLCETLSTENFVCLPGQLDLKIRQHTKKPGGKSDTISAEYKHVLERIQSVEFSYTLGQDLVNRPKNRFSEVLPSDQHIVYLTDGANGNYINAVVADGYRGKKQWVATQLPLSQTVTDFWQLILEKDIRIVVQLQIHEKSFYPARDSALFKKGDLNIRRISSTGEDEYIKTITLEVQHKMKEEQVIVLLVNGWPADALPTPDVVLSVHTALERLQQQTSSTAMCVTCLDGSSRCGLYICAHNAIEKLKVEQQVDIYSPTVLAKLRRPLFIPSIEEYQHLYLVMKDYLDRFSEYANFT